LLRPKVGEIQKKQTTIHMIPKKDHINKSTIDSIIFDHNHIYNPYVIDFLITFHIQKKIAGFSNVMIKKGIQRSVSWDYQQN